jgi:HEAT repeat protein
MYDINEANLSKGKAKPFIILGALGAVAAIAVGLLAVTYEADAERMTPDQGALEKKRILVLPIQEQIAEFRKYASNDLSPYLKEEGLKRLAWAKDPTGVELAVKALKDPEQKIRAQAALALTEYGLPAAESAKPALVQALKEAGAESRPQIAWALVVLKEPSAFNDIMALYRSGELSAVQRLGGGLAFDPNLLVELISLDQLASMYKDESASVRQLVATVLSRKADPKYTDQLIALVKDTDKTVAHQAAPGLGKIGDARAREPLVAALKGQPADERTEYLQALRNGIGTKGLVVALDTVGAENKTHEWHQVEQIWRHIDELNDPSGADALVELLQKDIHPHWSYRVGRALAAVGDLRGVAPLVTRLRQQTEKIYTDETDQEQLLKRNNNERVEAARLLADLAVLHPNELEKLRSESEHAVWSWMSSLPMPHANGLRALTRMKSTLHKAKLKEWADPNEPLPLEGQQPPMPDAWVVAQSALRYLGMQAEPANFDILTKQLTRKDPKLTITMDALQGGGVAILGMSLRAIGVGASQGLSEWRNQEAFEPLLKYIEDEKENDQSRQHACAALAWVANDEGMVKVAEKIQQYSGDAPADQFRRACFLETLVQRPIPGTAAALLPLLTPASEFETRHQVARALGKSGLSADVEAKLFEMLKDPALQLDAALALMLGGSPETASRALASLADTGPEALLELQEMWYRSFGYWSNEDLEQGHIFRFVDNAVAAARVEIRDASQDWVTAQLARQFDNLLYDNGPHSFTRVVLRHRLMSMAKGDDAQKRAGAIRTLKFMNEQGVLLSLRDATGETGKLASVAYHELTNPKVNEGLVKDFKEEEK